MLNRLFGPFYFLLTRLELVIDMIKKELDYPGTLASDFPQKSIKTCLTDLRDECTLVGLPESVKHINRVLKRLELKTDYSYFSVHLDDIRDGIIDEGRDHSVLVISPDRSKLFLEEPHPWDPVIKTFPSASDDVASVLLCYMYDENTASVFHSMRILEAGLKAFAEALNVPFGADVWHVVLDQIESEIRELERHWPKGKIKTEFLQFYSAAAKEFRYFKDGWRNYVSHNLARYDGPQALSTLTHVRDFMVQLSSRFSEN